MITNALAIEAFEQAEPMLAPIHPLQCSIHSPFKILLVEDNVSDAEMTRITLDKVDIPYALDQLQKGTDVLPYLTHKRRSSEPFPDLMLLDIGLPGEDGFEIIADIAKMRGAIHDIPIVILTGYEHFAYLQKSSELYITDYLVKPCNIDKLRSLMTRISSC